MITNHLPYRYQTWMAQKLLGLEFYPRIGRTLYNQSMGDLFLVCRRPKEYSTRAPRRSQYLSSMTDGEKEQEVPYFLSDTKYEDPALTPLDSLITKCYYPKTSASKIGLRIVEICKSSSPFHVYAARSLVSYPEGWAYAKRSYSRYQRGFEEGRWTDDWDNEGVRFSRARLKAGTGYSGVIARVSADIKTYGKQDTYNLLRGLLPEFNGRPFVHDTIDRLCREGQELMVA